MCQIISEPWYYIVYIHNSPLASHLTFTNNIGNCQYKVQDICFATLPWGELALPSMTANATLLINTLGMLELTHTVILPIDSSTGDGSGCMLRTGKSDERERGNAIHKKGEGGREKERE